MNFTQKAWEIFNRSIDDYHRKNDVYAEINNPYEKENLIEHLLYNKNWIDTVQWHLEDIIRDPEIDPHEAIKIKDGLIVPIKKELIWLSISIVGSFKNMQM